MADHPKERRIPLILVGVGLVLYAIAAFTLAGAGSVGPVLMAVIIGGSIQTVLLIVSAFIVAGFLNIGFGEFQSAIVKFAGACIFSGGLGAILPFGGIAALIVFFSLIIWLFELEVTYAVILTIVYFVLSLLVAFILRAAFR